MSTRLTMDSFLGADECSYTIRRNLLMYHPCTLKQKSFNILRSRTELIQKGSMCNHNCNQEDFICVIAVSIAALRSFRAKDVLVKMFHILCVDNFGWWYYPNILFVY